MSCRRCRLCGDTKVCGSFVSGQRYAVDLGLVFQVVVVFRAAGLRISSACTVDAKIVQILLLSCDWLWQITGFTRHV